MKVTVSINIEFEPSDNEECGEFRNAETAFRGNWDALPDAVGQALAMIGPPRPIVVIAKLCDDLGIEPGLTLSGQMAECSEKIIQAFNRVDDMVRMNAGTQEIIAEMAVI